MKRSTIYVLSAALILVVAGTVYGVLTIRRGFSTRDRPGVIETALATSTRRMAVPNRYKSMKNPVPDSPDSFEDGMEHWADHCASCHANNGNGDTMYGNGMYPRPPDMRAKATQEMSDGELYYTIKNGIRLSGMPAFGDPGDNDVDSWKLVVFIRHLPALSEQQQMQMEKLNPKSPDEMQEEMEEEKFLNGGNATATPMNQHTHH